MAAATAATPNLLDRLIAYALPGVALRRNMQRQALTRAYEGAARTDGWNPRRAGASPNADHAADASSLRARSRALVQNVPYIRRGLESLVANVIGTGITPRSMAPNKAQARRIDALWNAWASVADADGRLDLYGLQAAAYRAAQEEGEVLCRLRSRRPQDGLPVPLQIQLLSIDWLDSGKSGNADNGEAIVNGIQYDLLGRATQYWLFDQHPGELVTFRRGPSATSRPVPAASIIHLYTSERPGQGRGFPRLAPVIPRVRDLQLYEDAELQRKNLETRLSVLASGDVSAMAQSESEDLSTVRKTGELGSLHSGSIVQVPTGVNLTVIEPKAAGGYVEYLKYNLHLIAAGFGVTYPMMTGDVAEGNFSSTRMATMEFRRCAEQEQWLTIIPRLCMPIWRAFIAAAKLDGSIPADASDAVDWATPKWDYVNPEQDVQADLAEVFGGLSTFSEKLRRRGYKPDQVFAELKTDIERLRADGTLDVLLQFTARKLAAPAPADQGGAATTNTSGNAAATTTP